MSRLEDNFVRAVVPDLERAFGRELSAEEKQLARLAVVFSCSHLLVVPAIGN